MSRDPAYLLDVIDAAKLAMAFVETLSFEDFEQDALRQAAVQHKLLVIGEAVKRLSSEFRDQHSALPWQAMAGMRDRLIHDYDEVDIAIVWNTVRENLPPVVAYLEPLLPTES